MDDYQYKTLDLPSKNQGLFGYGGSPNSEGIGFSGRLIDSSGGFAGGSVGGTQGQVGPQGSDGPQGDPGVLFPNAQKGDMIFYNIGLNTEGWALLHAPANGAGGIFSVENEYPSWITASDKCVIFSDNNLNYGILSPPPPNKQYALGQSGGASPQPPEWVEITQCP